MKAMFTRRGAAITVVLALSSAAFVAAQGAWKELKDLSAFTVAAGGGRGGQQKGAPPSTNPAERSWTMVNGVISSVPPAESKQPSGGLSTMDKYYDFELEFDYKLDEAPTTDCTPKLGPKKMTNRSGQEVTEEQANLSTGAGCAFNSGISFRSGYQLNLGRREAGEYVGVVVHRELPEAIRGNVDWLSTGDCGSKNHTYLQDCSQFPEVRKKNDWNHVRLMFKGDHLQAWLNGKQIVDVMDKPMTDKFPNEAAWGQPQPISIQFPPAGEGGGFAGRVQFRNVRVRTL